MSSYRCEKTYGDKTSIMSVSPNDRVADVTAILPTNVKIGASAYFRWCETTGDGNWTTRRIHARITGVVPTDTGSKIQLLASESTTPFLIVATLNTDGDLTSITVQDVLLTASLHLVSATEADLTVINDTNEMLRCTIVNDAQAASIKNSIMTGLGTTASVVGLAAALPAVAATFPVAAVVVGIGAGVASLALSAISIYDTAMDPGEAEALLGPNDSLSRSASKNCLVLVWLYVDEKNVLTLEMMTTPDVGTGTINLKKVTGTRTTIMQLSLGEEKKKRIDNRALICIEHFKLNSEEGEEYELGQNVIDDPVGTKFNIHADPLVENWKFNESIPVNLTYDTKFKYCFISDVGKPGKNESGVLNLDVYPMKYVLRLTGYIVTSVEEEGYNVGKVGAEGDILLLIRKNLDNGYLAYYNGGEPFLRGYKMMTGVRKSDKSYRHVYIVTSEVRHYQHLIEDS